MAVPTLDWITAIFLPHLCNIKRFDTSKVDLIYYVYHICYDLLGRIEKSAQWFIISAYSLQGAEFCPQLDDDIGDDAEDDGDDDNDDHDDGNHGDDNHDSRI